MTRYELLDRIGVGGMAEIFRGKAVAAGGFEKPVAIKRILPHLSQDKRFVELLIAEAKVLSLLKHRNIVQIFDVGLGDDGQYFLVMEYVDGKDLGAIQRGIETRRKKLSFDLALHIVAEICEALEHAHTARAPDGKPMALVHRDVSPSNVLLSRAGEVKLTDFGIAKRAESEATGFGAVRGKFAYISPEQARNEQIGPRSDVFSVGILLWELVTNRRLFSQLGDMEALRAVRDPNIQRPSSIDPSLPPDLDRVVMSALARERDQRPSAGNLGQKLRTLRYSLESTVGDPATELARVIDTAEQVERSSVRMDAPPPRGQFDSVEPGEMTVIRIRTADEFSRRADNQSISMARQVIDRFEEEETRLAQLSGEQLRMLRSKRSTDSGELEPATPPRPKQGKPQRSKRPTEEPTIARGAIETDDEPTVTPSYDEADETRLVAPRDRRTPMPSRQVANPPPPRTNEPRRAEEPYPTMQQPRAQTARPLPPPSPPMPNNTMPLPPAMPPAPPSQPQYVQPPGFPPPEQAYPPPPAYPQWQPPPPRIDATVPDRFSSPYIPPPQPMTGPPVAGFQPQKPTLLRPWMLVVGALLMALLAFLITRTFIHNG